MLMDDLKKNRVNEGQDWSKKVYELKTVVNSEIE